MSTSKESYRFIQSMRWFGPADVVSLNNIRQAGCSAVVTALHHIPNGEVWSVEEIQKRKRDIEIAGMKWEVVESVPIHESIKIQQSGFERYIQNYSVTIQNLAACGIKVVTYNFMPVLDWTRTDLSYEVNDGSKALRFSLTDLALFDLYILRRKGAENDYPETIKTKAAKRFSEMNEFEKAVLQKNIIAGLPGSEEGYTLGQLQEALSPYRDITEEILRKHLQYFLSKIVPIAEECGIVLAIHPDDPPCKMLGLPRVVKNAQDIDAIIKNIPSLSNGLCFCTGSFGVDPTNNLPEMIKTYAERIHFVHLRNIRRDDEGNFYEDNHLDGSVDMYRVVKNLVEVMEQRKIHLPLRPDHGHQMLDDLQKKVNPGYSAIGRLRGLAELRGLELGISRSFHS
ncbi:MAG: mannonate dehydratase [Bacteriovoracaceae bacterium]